MNPRRSFLRKNIYLVAIAVLLVPLFWMGQPSTGTIEEIDGVRQVGRDSPGGKLAKLRAEHGLSETQIGDLDPVGETMKLATFGLRGVATVLLWEKSHKYQMKKDWTNLAATLNQIAKLEPHFITVWRHQAWNLSFNVSAEFDGYRERYHWVIEGIKFIKKGVALNRREPFLVADVGRFTAYKIGRADEAKQFRELFLDDDEFHAEDEEFEGSRPRDARDNWLTGKYWFRRAEAMVDNGAPLKKTAPLIFFKDRPMCQMNYAEFLEQDGFFGEKAKLAWRLAAKNWHEFGSRDLPARKGDIIRLNDKESHYETILRLNDQLDQLAPGAREALHKERQSKLTEEEKEALSTPLEEQTEDQYTLAREAANILVVLPREVAQKVTDRAERKKALEMADQIMELDKLARLIGSDRQIVNFEYWRMRANMEQTPQVLKARELIHQGEQAAKAADLLTAKEFYDAGLAEWRELLDTDEFAFLVTESNTVDDLHETVTQYRRLLEKCEEPFPQNFILQDVLDEYKRLRPDEED